MAHRVKAAVVKAQDAPVSIETIIVPNPGPGEVVVDVTTCGVCHTDWTYVTGGVGDNYPYLLGHESTAVVSEIGEGVTNVQVGDKVILNWRAVCGECRACEKGQPQYCFATHNAKQKMTLEDGTELEAALGIGSFAEKTLVAAGQCTKIENVDASQDAAVGLLGCGVMAGIGATINTGEAQRGESVAVIGCGGVGMAAIAGAQLAGATTIIAVDIDDAKLEHSKAFGATHTVNSKNQDAVETIRELTNGFGADLVVEAVGHPETYKQAFYARDLAGRVVLVGVPRPEMELTLPFQDVFSRGGSLKSSWYGDCLPSRDFPMLVEQYRLGRLDLDGFVTERIGLEDVNEAFEKMNAGKVLRSVVELQMARIDHLETSGTFSLDGETHNVDNNVWIVGNDSTCIVIDPSHDTAAIQQAVAGRTVSAILLTHGHDDHISEVAEFRQLVDAPVLINNEDRMLWDMVYPDSAPDGFINDGDTFTVAGITLKAIHTPGHSPGSTCFYAPELDGGVLFSGDTLFNGGPGATGRSFSSFDTIIESITTKLFTLPEDTKVLTGHGDSTSIGNEKPHLQEWLDRGH